MSYCPRTQATGHGNRIPLRGTLLNGSLTPDPVSDAFSDVADRAEDAEASESIARCMRAQDGTIGRANAWVLSIRPKP